MQAYRNIIIFASALYLGFNGGSEGWYSAAVTAGTSAVQTYGEFLGVRYEYFTLNGVEQSYEVVDSRWMHFVKGSNWNRANNHNDRINFLMKELKNISK